MAAIDTSSVEPLFNDAIRIVGIRLVDPERLFALYNVVVPSAFADTPATNVVVPTLAPGFTRSLLTDIRPAPVVVARATPADVFVVRAAVVRPAVAVRPATVPVRATLAPFADARDEPPVARVAAARVAAVFVVVRVDVVVAVVRGDVADVPRDATVRDAVERGEAFVVVRAATARDELPFAAPRPDVADVPDVGIARDAVVRVPTGVEFTGAREALTGVFCVTTPVSASTISSSEIIKKPFSSYIASAYSIASFSV